MLDYIQIAFGLSILVYIYYRWKNDEFAEGALMKPRILIGGFCFGVVMIFTGIYRLVF